MNIGISDMCFPEMSNNGPILSIGQVQARCKVNLSGKNRSIIWISTPRHCQMSGPPVCMNWCVLKKIATVSEPKTRSGTRSELSTQDFDSVGVCRAMITYNNFGLLHRHQLKRKTVIMKL